MGRMEDNNHDDPVHINRPLSVIRLQLEGESYMRRLEESRLRHPSAYEREVVCAGEGFVYTQTRKRPSDPGGRIERP